MLKELHARILSVILSVVLFVFILVAAVPAPGIDLVGRLVGGRARDVEVRDGYAYVADSHGFLIFDITDPGSPELVGCDLAVGAGAVTLRGRYAFVTPLRVYDIGDPRSPVLVGECDILCAGEDICVQGDFAYTPSDLAIADISDITNIHIVGHINLPDWAHGLDVEGRYAYVASYMAGMRIVDVADPEAPVEVGYFDTPGGSHDVEVVSGRAYLSDGPLGLSVIDVCDPANPKEIGYEVTRGWTTGIQVSGGRAYMGDAVGGGVILDISNPANPFELGYFKTPAGAHKVFGLGDYAYVADAYAGLRIYDISDPSAAFEVGSYDAPGYAQAVDAEGKYAYVVEDEYDMGLAIIDVEDPGRPRTVSRLVTEGWASRIDYSDGCAYVVDNSEGLIIIDVSDPHAPYETASILGNDLIVSHWVTDVFVRDKLAYVTLGGDSSLAVVNVEDASDPSLVGSLNLNAFPRAVFVEGEYAYIACGYCGLVIADISDPSNPEEIGRFSYDCYDRAYDVCVSGKYAYLASQRCGLIVVSVWAPSFPNEISRLSGDWRAETVTVRGNTVYVGTGSELKVIDVQDPRYPVQVDGIAFPQSRRVASCCSEGKVFAAVDGSGLYILEYAEPYYIKGQVRDISGRGIAGTAVSLSGDSTLVDTTDADGFYDFRGLEGGDYSHYTVRPDMEGWAFEPPARRFSGLPESLEGQDFVGAPGAAAGEVVIVGGEEGYVRPDRGETATIIVNARSAGPVWVCIYTMNGERIWNVTEATIPAEEKRITWDCRSSDGNVVASGVYLVHVSGGGFESRGHVAIVR